MDHQRSSSFLYTKWTLFSLSLFGIISSIVMASLASNLVDSYAISNYNENTEDVKSVDKGVTIGSAIICILFNLLGLLGAYKEDFCLTLTYALLMTLSFFGGISVTIKTPTYWYSNVLRLIICISAYVFAQELKILRNRMFTTPMIVSSAQPQTVVHITPGYSNQLYGQMYGQQYSNEHGVWHSPPPRYNEDCFKFQNNS